MTKGKKTEVLVKFKSQDVLLVDVGESSKLQGLELLPTLIASQDTLLVNVREATTSEWAIRTSEMLTIDVRD